MAEPEIAVHIGHDLAGGGDRAAAAAAIAALGPAIELADADLPFEDPEAILKGNIFQRHVILGEPDASRAGGSTAGLTARVFRRERRGGAHERPGGRHGQDRRHRAPRRRPARGLRREARRPATSSSAGSVVPPVLVEADETAVAYALDPIGTISVAFTR